MGAEQNFDWAASVTSLIDWWREAGMDVAIAEQPRNWLLASPEASAEPQEQQTEPDRPVAAPLTARAAVVSATPPPRPAKPMPTDIAALEAWRLSDDAPDSSWAGPRIGAAGPSSASLMVIIEMPERDDGAAGTLLSGACGALFDRMLAAIGRSRETIYLVPMCVVRPSTGHIPPDALPQLAATLRHHVQLAGPRRVLVIGNAVSRALLGADINDMRGVLRPINQSSAQHAEPIEAVASYHPRFLLERPAAKAEAWKDLLMLAQGIAA